MKRTQGVDVRMTTLWIGTVSVAASLLTGCATTPLRVYEGAKRPMTEVARISVEQKKEDLKQTEPLVPMKISIRVVDGKDLPKSSQGGYPKDILVAPGDHDIVAWPDDGGDMSAKSLESMGPEASPAMRMKAEAGQSYVVRFREMPKILWFWVEDSGTGKKVCDPKRVAKP